MKTRWITRAVVTAMGSFGLAAAAPSRAEGEFGALPGLWQTTVQAQGAAGEAPPPEVQWHCVDEAGDPWVDYARLPATPTANCERTSFERSTTSLRWKVECSAPGSFSSTGAIVFDSPSHYTGTVAVEGTLLGFPLHGVTTIEGQRKAACTSPSD